MQSRERLTRSRPREGRDEDGAGAMREQTAEIDISVLANRPEASPVPTGMLAGREAKPAGKLPCPPKRVDVSDTAHERRRG